MIEKKVEINNRRSRRARTYINRAQFLDIMLDLDVATEKAKRKIEEDPTQFERRQAARK